MLLLKLLDGAKWAVNNGSVRPKWNGIREIIMQKKKTIPPQRGKRQWQFLNDSSVRMISVEKNKIKLRVRSTQKA